LGELEAVSLDQLYVESPFLTFSFGLVAFASVSPPSPAVACVNGKLVLCRRSETGRGTSNCHTKSKEHLLPLTIPLLSVRRGLITTSRVAWPAWPSGLLKESIRTTCPPTRTSPPQDGRCDILIGPFLSLFAGRFPVVQSQLSGGREIRARAPPCNYARDSSPTTGHFASSAA